MSDTKETGDKVLRTAPPAGAPAPGARKTLTLTRTVEQGPVRQNFGQGRSKSVQVEVKKRRVARPGGEEGGAGGQQLGKLSDAEMEKRLRVLGEAQKREAEEAKVREAEAERQRIADAEAERQRELDRQRAEAERIATGAPATTADAAAAEAGKDAATAKSAAGETNPAAAATASQPSVAKTADAKTADAPASAQTPAAAAAAKSAAGQPLSPNGKPAAQSAADAAKTAATAKTAKPGAAAEAIKRAETAGRKRNEVEDDDVRMVKKGGIKIMVKAPVKTEEKKERVRLTINNAMDESSRERSLASLRRRRERERLKAMGVSVVRDKVMREVIIPEAITIQELANRMTERSVDVIKLLMKQGVMHKINDVIDADTAELIVTEFGHTPKRVSEADVLEGFISTEKEDDEHLEPRAPVVTIMGHVDHGKTSLLDAIRKTNVVSGEAGGITQHIGAYQVRTPLGDLVTFIDTPGHEAFTAMRARGAKVTDIVVLVVAADDGVMPQTVEAINHAKAAGVPIIVAINKIDKPQSDPTRVRTELLQHGIVVESMSGEVLDVPVSALTGEGLDKLLEAISLQAELLQLKANPERSAEGYVIEAKLERGRGPVGTVLVQRGTLDVGDIVVAGEAWGRVRALLDDTGEHVDYAGPSVPVEILGFDSAPEAGDQFAVVESEARAREITDYRIHKRRETLGSAASTGRTLEQMMQQMKDSAGRKEFPLLIKGDVQGSVEAISGALHKIGNDEVQARLVHTGVGQITESDVSLSNASKAIIIGFNVRANAQAKQLAEQLGIEIRYYNIIYDLVDEVKGAMSGLLAPTRKEHFLGYATIKQVFNISKVGKVAGCMVSSGKVERGAKVRLLREKVVIHEGTLSVLKRFKDDVKEVNAGQECGMAFANYQDIRENDEIECFTVEIIARSL